MMTFTEIFISIVVGAAFFVGSLYMGFLCIEGFKRVYHDPFNTPSEKFEKICGYIAFTIWTPMTVACAFAGFLLFVGGIQLIFK